MTERKRTDLGRKEDRMMGRTKESIRGRKEERQKERDRGRKGKLVRKKMEGVSF